VLVEIAYGNIGISLAIVPFCLLSLALEKRDYNTTTMAWPLEATVTLTHDDYTVAWLCALPIEKAAVRNMLDELHIPPLQLEHDKNIYTFGRICGHNVVIVCQGDMGTTAASVVATRMDSTFRRLRLRLLVGIAGGVPEEKDIRLGDVVVSKGDGRSGGVIAHDRGKVTLTGFESRPFLNSVPEVLRNAISELESRLIDQDSKITTYLSEATKRNSRFSTFERPSSVADNLFQKDYPHANPKDKTCADCAKIHTVSRPPRAGPLVHFGIVASGNQVIKNAEERARIHAAHPGVLAIEMEAAGLMDVFGCATIRGICDYADSHKNDGWHKYASATAAVVAKEILGIIPVAMVVAAPPVGQYSFSLLCALT
jgi:nucleoside phosphorylase